MAETGLAPGPAPRPVYDTARMELVHPGISAALERIEAKIDSQDRLLGAIINALPFPYRHKIREALIHGDNERPTRGRSAAARAAVIGTRAKS